MMIPRTLVPPGARLSEEDAKATSRRRPSNLDERTLVPSSLPILILDTKTTIPSSLPLDSIAARVVVPRDVNVEAVQRPDDSNLPSQPSDMDERMTVPQGAMLPEELPEHLPVSEELVEPDVMSTGEVTLLPPENRGEKSREDKIKTAFGTFIYVLLLLALFFEPQIFGPHVRTKEQEEIGRRQISLLVDPSVLEALEPPAPRAAPAPHPIVKVDPKVLKKVAPPIEKPAPAVIPTPEPPKRDLPNAPVPQQSALQPTPTLTTPPPRNPVPDAPVKLDIPQTPQPQQGLILPKQSLSPGGAIRDAERAQRMNTPAPIGGGGQLPSGGGGGNGGHGRGTAAAGIQMLTDTEGIDFNDYLRRVYLTVQRNWYAVMPTSVSLGEQGVVSLQFKITKNGIVPDGDPAQVFSSGKEPLDRAAFSSIRASSPFPPLPPGFKADHIELRFTYYYNIEPPK